MQTSVIFNPLTKRRLWGSEIVRGSFLTVGLQSSSAFWLGDKKKKKDIKDFLSSAFLPTTPRLRTESFVSAANSENVEDRRSTNGLRTKLRPGGP